MSYILEALRRAETERERKRRVPGLHTQPVPVPAEEQRAQRSKVWRWVALGLAAGVLLPLLWRWWADDPASDEALTARPAVAGSVTPHADAAPPPMAAAPPPDPATPPPVAAAPPAAPAPVAPAATQRPPARAHTPPPATAAGKSSPKADSVARAAATAAPTVAPSVAPSVAPPADSAKAAAAPVAAASAPEPRLRSLAELPSDLRSAVPPLSFGGSVYSEVPAQRMVILNGQVLREGDAVTDDLLVEQIRPRSAVLRLRGQRFEMPF